MKTLVLLTTVSFVALASCKGGGMEGTARTRAANDLGCAEDQIAVTNLGGTSYRAKGCAKEATYNCIESRGDQGLQTTCVREEQKDAPTSKAAVPSTTGTAAQEKH